MKIGVIGIGEMGGTLARCWCEKGHTVRVANSRGPLAIKHFADSIGAEAADVRGAVEGAEIVLLAMAFPIAFLLFAIPMPTVVYNEIVFPLQFIASKFATGTLEMLNLFPIMREGNVLILPGMRLEVVEACSGIRSLMSLLALAAGYGYVVERSVAVRWFMVLAMVPLAIVSNGLRIMITAIMAHYIGPQANDPSCYEITMAGWQELERVGSEAGMPGR